MKPEFTILNPEEIGKTKSGSMTVPQQPAETKSLVRQCMWFSCSLAQCCRCLFLKVQWQDQLTKNRCACGKVYVVYNCYMTTALHTDLLWMIIYTCDFLLRWRCLQRHHFESRTTNGCLTCIPMADKREVFRKWILFLEYSQTMKV